MVVGLVTNAQNEIKCNPIYLIYLLVTHDFLCTDKKHLDISQNILFYDPQRKQSHPFLIWKKSLLISERWKANLWNPNSKLHVVWGKRWRHFRFSKRLLLLNLLLCLQLLLNAIFRVKLKVTGLLWCCWDVNEMLTWAPVVYDNKRSRRCFDHNRCSIMDRRWCGGEQYFDRCHHKRLCKKIQ